MKAEKKYFLIIFLLVSAIDCFAQPYQCLTTSNKNNIITSQPSSCTDLLNYIPDPSNNYQNTPVITYRINIHLFRRSDGSGIYQPSDITAFNQQIDWVNSFYTNIEQPTMPVSPPAQYINDSRVRFKLMNIYFHDNDTYYSSTYNLCGSTYYDNFGINKESEINIFYFQNPNFPQGSGCGPFPFVNMACITPSWAGAQLLAHELGHVIGLPHTGECYSSCTDDYYDDTYTPDCNKGWLNCGVYETSTCLNAIGISNNLMGYNICRSYLSPKQMGEVHKNAISYYSYTKYLICDYNSANSVTVSTSATWNRSKIISGDLTVSNNSNLTIQCSLIMSDYSTITVNNGSALIIESDAILTGLCDDYWSGSLLVNQGGTLIIKNNSQIKINRTGNIEIKSGAYICIENGADINLLDYLSVIKLRCGYISGINPITGLTANCTTDPASYQVTGNGEIITNPTTADLYIQDTPQDNGVEPNPDTGPMWVSEDIWNRTTCDNGTFHQNPEYGQQNCIYVRVTNRGCTTSSSSEELRLYWAKASTGLSWPTQWVNYNPDPATFGNGTCTATVKYGDEITTSGGVTIPAIDGGQSYVISIPWNTVPNPANFACFGADQHHFCLLARIETSTTSPFGMSSTEGTDVNLNTLQNNNIAWKNLSVVDNWAGNIDASTTILRNVEGKSVSTKIKFDNPKEDPFMNYGSIKINLGPALFQKWDNGGRVGSGIEVCSDSIIHLLNPHSWIGNIQLDSLEAMVIQAIFDLIIQPEECNFDFDISQYTSETTGDKLVGGNRFTLNTCTNNNNARITAPASENTENIQPEKTHGVKIYPNPTKDEFTVEYYYDEGKTGRLEIYSVLGEKLVNIEIKPNEILNINVSSFYKGVYLCKVSVNNIIVYTEPLIIIR